MQLIKEIDKDSVYAVVSDPPYGMSWNTKTARFTGGKYESQYRRGKGRNDDRPVYGDDKPFDPLPWLCFPKVILWGYNHFASRLPKGTVLVWIKKYDEVFGKFLSDAELAWMNSGCGVYCRRDTTHNAIAAKRVHPTQKPVSLMKWCLDKAKVPAGATVLDPYMGSGSTGVACIETGRNFIGIEMDEHYFEVAKNRLEEAESQLLLSLVDAPK